MIYRTTQGIAVATGVYPNQTYVVKKIQLPPNLRISGVIVENPTPAMIYFYANALNDTTMVFGTRSDKILFSVSPYSRFSGNISFPNSGEIYAIFPGFVSPIGQGGGVEFRISIWEERVDEGTFNIPFTARFDHSFFGVVANTAIYQASPVDAVVGGNSVQASPPFQLWLAGNAKRRTATLMGTLGADNPVNLQLFYIFGSSVFPIAVIPMVNGYADLGVPAGGLLGKFTVGYAAAPVNGPNMTLYVIQEF